MRPYLVNKVQSADYQDLEQTEPSELSQAVSSSTADQLTELLVATVEHGTASPAADPRRQRGRQDRHRAERHRSGAAVRLVHVVRARRQPRRSRWP